MAEEAAGEEGGFLPAPELLVPTDSRLTLRSEASPAAAPGGEPGRSIPWEGQGSGRESPRGEPVPSPQQRLLRARALRGSAARFRPTG